ncbi:ThuA domain-containing protein [Chitinophaga horti]|uniref:ThuA domain-containing protein n=1 Tax=Chitinophaga horti TaxID=2920382 RepID=A0ABY6IXI5_9BACT|nr:ThuA domain-containing protein [Chitinophaga horti]UYQ92091.1 ThuA domain-containing protein [Chitinophaga horti]
MRIRSLVFLATLAVFAFLAGCKKTREGQPRILVFTKTSGFHHAAIPAGIRAIQKLGAENGFIVDTTENASKFNEDSLAKYAAVVFLSTTGDVLNNFQEADFERYIQSGGGFVGVHAAADTEYDWAWYGKLVGGYFESHPPGVHKAKINVLVKNFAATKDLPEVWEHTDEWYNYKNFNKEVKVLMNLDEKSYTGGKMGAEHPISWYHDFDGGRAFYTGLGHTEESYTEAAFLKHLLGGIEYAIGDNKVLDYSKASAVRVPQEDRFSRQVLAGGEFFEPTEMTILPNLDILVAQRRGEILMYNNGTKTLSQVGFLNVYHKTNVEGVNAEEGVLGIQADPDFEKNHYVFIFYSPADTSVNRLSRFKFENNQLDLASEKVVLQFYSQRQICCHTGGSIAFGPDKLLYLSTGDNTTPFDEPNQPYTTKSFGPIDDRPGHLQYDGRRTSANTNDLRGKVLRIRVKEDGSYEIPDGNLYKPGTANTKPEIYVMGTRNPYRISVDQKTGYLYWGEVGPDAANDIEERGPRGYDEVNQAKTPGNYGYPLFIGNNKPYRQFNYETGESGPAWDPAKPVNISRNNTGLKDLPPARPAFIWYPYGKSEEFPLVGAGGRNAEAGPVYYSDLYPKETRLPDYYDGKLFIYDWIRNWIMAVTMDKDGNYVKMERFMPGTKFHAPIDMEMGPDGRLYVLEYGSGWFSKNPDAALTRIDYNGGNRAPVAKLKVDKITGGLPFKVKVNAEGSKDTDGDPITYVWHFGDGNRKETKDPQAEFTFSQPGEYLISVEVFDDKGAHTQSNVVAVYAGNETPDVKVNVSGNSMFYFPGKKVNYTVAITDKEDGNSANSTLDMANVYIKPMYVEGRDKAAMPQGHQVISGAIAGKNMVESGDCKSCHKVDEKSIGPSFKQVSEKYKNDPKAMDYLAQKIIRGGAGVWGEVAMSAHPTITTGEAKQIAEWVLSLAGGVQQSPSLPLTGSVDPLNGGEWKEKGIFYLVASYTDKGAAGIRPITGTANVELRNPIFIADHYDGADGMSSMEVEGKRFVLPSKQGWLSYKDIDFAEVNGIEFNYAVQDSTMTTGYVVTAHLDSPTGQQLGETVLGPGASAGKLNIAAVNFATLTGNKPRSLYLVVKAQDPAIQSAVLLYSFKLVSK